MEPLLKIQWFLFLKSNIVKIFGITFEEGPYDIIPTANKFLLTAKGKGNMFANLRAVRPPGEAPSPSASQILLLKMQTLPLTFLCILFLEMTKIHTFLLSI